jgi:hypothetical protein
MRAYAQALVMAEPELPGILPPPKPPWYQRLFARRKWPGWASIGLGSIRIFHIGEDIDFALGILRSLGGELGMIAAVIASPIFAAGLIAYGVLHLIVVGEPKNALRHHAWSYVGWGVFGVCFTAIVLTTAWGTVEAYIEKQVTMRTPGARPAFWYLSTPQKVSLAAALDDVEEKDRFPVNVKCATDAPSRTLTNDLGTIFLAKKWAFTADCLFSGLRPDFLGIEIAVAASYSGKNTDDLPEPLKTQFKKLDELFNKSSIAYFIGTEPKLSDTEMSVLIGNGPKP